MSVPLNIVPDQVSCVKNVNAHKVDQWSGNGNLVH